MSTRENDLHECATAPAEQHATNSTVTAPGTVVVRYANQSGALVTVSHRPPQGTRAVSFGAECTACLDDSDSTFAIIATLKDARSWANEHAAECRALPQPDEQV